MRFIPEPMLMQLAEPEYMCPKCGYKFYVYDEDKRPDKCESCDLTFEWDWDKKHYFIDETGTTQVGVCDGMTKEEFERIVDKLNSIGNVQIIPNDVVVKIVTTAEEE